MIGNEYDAEPASLRGKTALVTGAATGIGRAIALGLAYRGASIAINFRARREDAENLAAEIRDAGAECILIAGDAGIREEAQRIVREVISRWGRLDILVNNAGIARDKSLRKTADDEWADIISVNSNGTYFCTSAALPTMVAQKYGRIINIVSGVAPTKPACNSRGGNDAIVEFTKALAIRMAPYNITANVVAPGYTCTGNLSRIPEHVVEQIRSRIPMGRFAETAEVASAAVFLAADADYITGQQLNVNGGVFV